MRSPLTIIGICGWAIPPLWFQKQIKLAFPDSHIKTFYPQNPADENEAIRFTKENSAELWIGYSLGSHWLLKYLHLIPTPNKVALLSPILGFPVEMKLGGKISMVQLNYLVRNLKRHPEEKGLIFDFLNQIGVDTNDTDFILNIEPSALLNGLKFLLENSIDPTKQPEYISVIGNQDPLTDYKILMGLIPDLIVVPEAGHHPAPLLRSLASSFRS